MKYHPFCGGKVSSKLKLLIAFDVIISAIALQFAIIGLVLISLFPSPSDLHPLMPKGIEDLNLSTVLVFVVFMVIDIMLDVWLWIIVPKKDKSKCQTWFIMKLTLEFCDAVGFTIELLCGHHTPLYSSLMILDFLFSAFFCWVVFAFILEIKTKLIHLDGGTNKFVKFFKSGGSNNKHSSSCGGGDEESNALKSIIDQ